MENNLQLDERNVNSSFLCQEFGIGIYFYLHPCPFGSVNVLQPFDISHKTTYMYLGHCSQTGYKSPRLLSHHKSLWQEEHKHFSYADEFRVITAHVWKSL
jgi:hypothetical protein